MRRPVVVKFGGSLLASAERDGLLSVAARHGAVVAPGGGPFADAVRDEQARAGFSDDCAHELAIRAMDQTARVLSDAAPGLPLAETIEELRQTRGSIWRPSPLALRADVPASWDVTSDSLALWLATELEATHLVLLKAAHVPTAPLPSAWAEAGLVDAHFPELAARFSGEILCLGPATADGLEAALRDRLERAAQAA